MKNKLGLKIYTGEKAKNLCHAIQKSFDDAYKSHCELYGKGIKTTLTHRYSPLGSGYFEDNGIYVAFDNTTGYFWIEEFKSKRKAKKWLKSA